MDHSQIIAALIPTISVIFGFGATYGMIRNKLNTMSRDISKLDHGNTVSATVEAKQDVINSNVAEEIETVKDRLDVHDLGIRNVEMDIVRIKAKCKFFETEE